MNVAIIDYGAGNTRSLQFALERIGVSSVLTADSAGGHDRERFKLGLGGRLRGNSRISVCSQ